MSISSDFLFTLNTPLDVDGRRK